MQTLSEAASKALLVPHGLPVAIERVVTDPAAAADAAREIGGAVVAKLCGDAIAHKTERNLVRLRLSDPAATEAAAAELLAMARPGDGDVAVLIAEMVDANRELIIGMQRTEQYGPVLMLGVGGIFAEVLEDVVFRLLPVTDVDISEMIGDLQAQDMLGEFRGEPQVDRDALAQALAAVAAAAMTDERITAIDVNPLLIRDGRPVAVDALVVLDDRADSMNDRADAVHEGGA